MELKNSLNPLKIERADNVSALSDFYCGVKAMEDQLSSTLFLSLDAYHTNSYSSVNFYKKCGFIVNDYGMIQNFNKERFGEISITVRMYKPLLY